MHLLQFDANGAITGRSTEPLVGWALTEEVRYSLPDFTPEPGGVLEPNPATRTPLPAYWDREQQWMHVVNDVVCGNEITLVMPPGAEPDPRLYQDHLDVALQRLAREGTR